MVANKMNFEPPCKKTFQPIRDIVALQVHRVSETEGGLMLADGSVDTREFLTATVIACGPECKWVKEGDVILVASSVQGVAGKHGSSGRQTLVREESLLAVSLLKGRGASDEERWAAADAKKMVTEPEADEGGPG